jgi:regulator of sigma E protease
VGYVAEDMPGEKAGLLPGDKILAINGKPVEGFAGSLDSITESIVLSSGNKIEFTIERPGIDEPLTLTSGFDTPKTKWFQRGGLRKVGIIPGGQSVVEALLDNSPAAKAGLEKGDEIVQFDGQKLHSPYQLEQHWEANSFKPVELKVRKTNGETVMVTVKPEKPLRPVDAEPEHGIFWDRSDYADVRIVHPNPFAQVSDSLKMMWVTISSVADPGTSIGLGHLAGPLGIGEMLYSLLQTENGWMRILSFMVLFNVNLAVLNMLPFPVLDGGHITLATFEKIFGRPLNMKALEIIQTVCALALISLMLFVSSKDAGSIFERAVGGDSSEEVVFPAGDE